MEDLDEIIEIQEIEHLINEDLIRERRPYEVKLRIDNFNKYNEEDFKERFRFKKETVQFILHLIEDHIRHKTDRNNAVQPLDQLLLCLRFYATGSFQITMADFIGVHRTTAGQIVKRVTTALVDLRNEFIKTPQNEEIAICQQNFYQVANFPRVVGVVDCTHIKISGPGGDLSETFRNRKGFFSLNVQVVCDSNFYIQNIVCNHPGSTHDSHIFNNSRIRMLFENGNMGTGILLGDGGYPCRPFIITPMANPNTPLERRFNQAQIKTRTIIERMFGIWKRRFPILSLGIRNKFPLALDIIMATAVLHNITVLHKDIQQQEETEIEENVVVNNDDDDNNNARLPYLRFFETLNI